MAPLFLVVHVCPMVFNLAKKRRKFFGRVSEVGKNDFSIYFFWLCVLFLVFLSLLRTPHYRGISTRCVKRDHVSGEKLLKPNIDAKHPNDLIAVFQCGGALGAGAFVT